METGCGENNVQSSGGEPVDRYSACVGGTTQSKVKQQPWKCREAAPAFVSAQQARPSFITSEWTHMYFAPFSLGIRATEIKKGTSVCRSWPKNNHQSRRLEVFAWHLRYVMSAFRVKFNLKERDDVVKLFWGQNSQEGRPWCSWFPDGVCVGCGSDSQGSDWGKIKKISNLEKKPPHIWQRIK